LTESFGWRSAFILIGGIAVLLAVLTWFFVIDRPDAGVEKGAGLERSRTGHASDWKFLSSLADVVRQKYFWTIAVWLFFAQGTLFSFYGLWAGPYLMDTYALSKPAAGNILSMIAIGMVVGGPFLGYLSDRVLESRKRVLVGASAVNIFVWSIMIGFFDTFSLPALFGIFFLMGITTSSIVVIVFTTVKELFPLEMAGTAIGTANLFGFFGGIVFQPLIGYILDIAGKIHGIYPSYAYQWTFWVFLGINLISLISILFSKETISTSGDRV
jgi:sugar phosphate permease